MKILSIALSALLLAAGCAHQTPNTAALSDAKARAETSSPAKSGDSQKSTDAGSALFGSPPPAVSPDQVRKAEALRLDALRALYSKDPTVHNPKVAFEKFQQAAEIGDPVSMDHLGGFYSTGTAGVERNCAKAIEWYEKSSRVGYQIAMNNLAYTLVSCDDKKLRDAAKAEDLMQYLFESNGLFVAWLDTYAAVLAEQKEFKKAADTMKVVVDLAEFIGGNPERVDEMKKALSLYQKKKPLDAKFLKILKTPEKNP